MNIQDLLDPEKMKAVEERFDGFKYTREGIRIKRREGIEPKDMLEVLNNLGHAPVTEDFSDSNH